MVQERTFEIKKSTIYWIVGILVLGLIMYYGSFLPSSNQNNKVNSPSVSSQTTPSKVDVGSRDPVLGNKDASISVIEYSDFECPFCGRAFTGAVAGLKASEEFVNGEINFVYKHFPLRSIHPNAQKAAEASVCAQNQGKFWEYHDLLFANQRALTIPDLKNYASQLNLDTKKFNTCLDSGETEAKVQADLDEVIAAGGRGTPHFIILNHKSGQSVQVSGAVPYANIAQAISQVK